MILEAPTPRRVLDIDMPDGAVIRARVHGAENGPRLLLSHGNGFAIDAYACFWAPLAETYELVVYDLRNHGANPLFGAYGHNIDGFVRDLDHLLGAIPAELGEKPTAGLYHSVSGITALHHAALMGWPDWKALILFDPPVVPAPGHALHGIAKGMELFLANWAMKRPDRFNDPAELAEVFKQAKGLSGWIAGAHEAMATAILCEDDQEGGQILACPRELEAAAYIANAFSRLWHLLPDLQKHSEDMLFIASDPDIEDARSPALVNRQLKQELGFNVHAVEGTTHLLQIERPDECRAVATDFLRSHGLG